MSLRRIAASLALAAAALTAAPAHAATVTSVVTLSDTFTLIGSGQASRRLGRYHRGTLPGFDATLGTLNSVAIAVEHYVTETHNITGNVPLYGTTGPLTGRSRMYTASRIFMAENSRWLNTSGSPFSLSCISADADPCTISQTRRTDASYNFTTFSAAEWDALFDARRTSVGLSSQYTLQNYRGRNEATYHSFANLTFTFDYTPPPSTVPLPASGVLLLAALGGGAVLTRRKRQRAAL